MVTGIGSVSSPGTPAAPMALAIIGTGEPQKRSSDNRRSNKPIMEKRRRARINNCLNELKTLILDAMKKDPARHSKLEKADILEMTVKHLENLQRQQVAMTSAADPTVVNKFRAGFSECASEVSRFSGLDPAVKRRLLQHLASCLTGSQAVIKQETQQVQVHILPSPPSSPEQQQTQNQLSASANGIYFTNGSGSGVQLVPTRLPNGDIALVLPAGHHLRQSTPATSSPATSPLPMLIPIPTRTASTASASSTSSISSGYDRLSVSSSSQNNPYGQPLSPAHSQNGFETDHRAYSPSLQKPLSLVMRKQKSYAVAAEEEKPWRPW